MFEEVKTLLKDSGSGLISGTVCGITGHPFDTMKVKMQVFPSINTTTRNTLINIWKFEGFRGFYQGFGPAMACNVFENGVLFLFYPKCCLAAEKITHFALPNNNNDQLFNNRREVITKTLGGSFAGFFATFAICPTELLKCRLQALRESREFDHKVNSLVVIKKVLKEEGIPGMFRGLTSTILREVPGYFLIFGGYEGTKYFLKPFELGNTTSAIAGGVGGLTYWSILYPIDLVKSKMQTTFENDQKYSIVQTFKNLYKENGIKRFYCGIAPTLIRAFLSNASLFYTYEYCQKYFKNS